MSYLSKNIAANLNRLRKSKWLSLEAASELTGVSKSMLHRIESGDGNPSINVLGKIADGLKIDLVELISATETRDLIVNLKEKLPKKKEDGQYKVCVCFPYESSSGLEVYSIELEPGGIYRERGHDEKVMEYVYTVEGKVIIETGEKTYSLNSEELLRFHSGNFRSYINSTDNKVKIISFLLTERQI